MTYVAYSDLYDGFPSQFTGAVCYGAGTRLRTIQSEIAIEDLSVGDLLWTIDAGYQPIVWIETLPQRNWRKTPFAAFACNRLTQPERDLILSPRQFLEIVQVVPCQYQGSN